MTEYIEIALNGLAWASLAVWRTLPLFAIVFLLTVLLRKRIPASYQCWLWMLVVARLLLPFSIGSPLAMSPNLDLTNNGVFINESRATPIDFETFTYLNDAGETITVNLSDTNLEPPIATEAIYNMVDEPVGESSLEVVLNLAPFLLAWTWFAGFAFFACRGLIAYCRFAWRLRGELVVEDQDIVDRVLRACDRVGVGRRPKIKVVGALDAPAVFGLFRPVLCLPPDWREQLSGEQLDWVFKHELAHVKRRDAPVLCVAGIARAVHWFHPLSWIAIARLHSSIEQAADTVATRDLTESNITEYGKLLLQYAGGNSGTKRPAVMGLLAMASSRGLRGRIEALSIGKSKRPWLTRLCLVPAVAMIASSGLTDARTPVPKTEVPRRVPDIQVALANIAAPTMPHLSNVGANDADVRPIEVNVEGALRKAAELQPGIDAERYVITYFTYPHLDQSKIEDGVLTTIATPQQEVVMRQSLAAFERVGPWQVSVECRLIESDIRFLNSFDWSGGDGETTCKRIDTPAPLDFIDGWHPAIAINEGFLQEALASAAANGRSASIPVRATKISDLESIKLIRRCDMDPRSNIVFAPKITLFNGQAAMISDVVQRPFVTDVSVIKGSLADALEPKISIYENGWSIRIRTDVTANQEVEVRCVLTDSRVGDVRLASLPLMSPNAPDDEVTIQIPSVQADSISVQSRLSADEALLVFSPKPYSHGNAPERGMGQVFMIRTQLISDIESMQAFVPE